MTVADWLIYGTGWRAQALGGLVVLAGLGFLLARLVGPARALRTMAIALGAFAALVYGRRERQAGWNDAHVKGERDADAAIDQAGRARADAVRRDADSRRLRDDDGYRRD
ncbi:hypothetical protein V5F59_20580 [Xanthobacter autotrophicus DSM 431]|uniref:hypothetical protein n=1 Tax=Xanthobacter nonsaccharivorans TaxID=3119912 RepID=UPI00372860FE